MTELEKQLKELFDGLKSNIKFDNSDDALGKYIISAGKNFYKGIKLLIADYKDKKVRCKRRLISLTVAVVIFTAAAITIELNHITVYAIYATAILTALIPIIYIIRIGAKKKSADNDYSKKLQDIGLIEGFARVKDSKGRYRNVKATPAVISVKKVNNFTTYMFKTNIVLADWIKVKEKMKTVFNCDILDIRYAKGSYNRVIVEMAKIGTDKLSNNIPWKNEYYQKGKITLGMSANGKFIRLDITKSDTVHMLIGGQTGSGKTGFSEKFLNDCIRNGYYINIIDRKGALDYVEYETAGVKVAITLNDTIEMTAAAVNELDTRLELFKKAAKKYKKKIRSLEAYNKAVEQKLARYVIFIDEASEVFSSFTQKKKIDAIKENIISIVRRGRALGMNVVLATQKCSAVVISTEIRSLLGTRICGYVDTSHDSRQILDHSYATGLPRITGRFTMRVPGTNDRFQDFQVFNLTEEEEIIYKPEGCLAIPAPTTFIINPDDLKKHKSKDEKLEGFDDDTRFTANPEKTEDKKENEEIKE